MKTNYNRTLQACFIGYVVQAIVNNFVPLLFLTFQSSYGISLQKITLLVTFNNRSKNSLTSIGDGMNCTFEHVCSNS